MNNIFIIIINYFIIIINYFIIIIMYNIFILPGGTSIVFIHQLSKRRSQV